MKESQVLNSLFREDTDHQDMKPPPKQWRVYYQQYYSSGILLLSFTLHCCKMYDILTWYYLLYVYALYLFIYLFMYFIYEQGFMNKGLFCPDTRQMHIQ